jgi:hypothetical protein
MVIRFPEMGSFSELVLVAGDFCVSNLQLVELLHYKLEGRGFETQ